MAINRWQFGRDQEMGNRPGCKKFQSGVDNKQLNSSFIEVGSFMNIQNIC
jgi:hypothetical protein